MTIHCSFGKSALGFCATLGHAANFQRAETITAPLTIEKKFTASLGADITFVHDVKITAGTVCVVGNCVLNCQ